MAYLGEAAGGLLGGMRARRQDELADETVELKRMLADRQLRSEKNKLYQDYLKMVNDNPSEAADTLSELGPSGAGLDPDQFMSLLQRSYRMRQHQLAGEQATATATGIKGLDPRATRYMKPEFVRQAGREDTERDAVVFGLENIDDPAKLSRYLAGKGVPIDKALQYANLNPEYAAKLEGLKAHFGALGKETGAAAAVTTPVGTVPGMPAPEAVPGRSVGSGMSIAPTTVGDVQAAQAGRMSRQQARGRAIGQFESPQALEAHEVDMALKRAQTELAMARAVLERMRQSTYMDERLIRDVESSMRSMAKLAEIAFMVEPDELAKYMAPETTEAIIATLGELQKQAAINLRRRMGRPAAVSPQPMPGGQAPASQGGVEQWGRDPATGKLIRVR